MSVVSLLIWKKIFKLKIKRNLLSLIFTVIHKVLLVKQLLHGFLVQLVKSTPIAVIITEQHVIPPDQGDVQPGPEAHCGRDTIEIEIR